MISELEKNGVVSGQAKTRFPGSGASNSDIEIWGMAWRAWVERWSGLRAMQASRSGAGARPNPASGDALACWMQSR